MNQQPTAVLKQIEQQHQREWLQRVIDATGKKPAQIAADAGINGSTLTRLLNTPGYTGTLSSATIAKITMALAVPGPQQHTGGRRQQVMPGFTEAERLEVSRAEMTRIIETCNIDNAQIAPPSWECHKLNTPALALAGYLPGDVLVVAMGNAAPQDDDIVCATSNNKTIWRVYQPPFLVAAASDHYSFRPVLVDSYTTITGIVVGSLRRTRFAKR